VIVPVPARPPAVNVVVGPLAGFSVPSPGGSSDQAAVAGTEFSNESTARTAKVCGVPAPTVAVTGLTLRLITGPGRIVSVCVPLVIPAAAAVSRALPARVSW
jgi:hypothetical protein